MPAITIKEYRKRYLFIKSLVDNKKDNYQIIEVAEKKFGIKRASVYNYLKEIERDVLVSMAPNTEEIS